MCWSFPYTHARNNGSLYLSWTGWTNSLRKRLTSGLSGCSPPSNWSSSLGLGSGISNLDNETTALRITAVFHSSMMTTMFFFKKAINVAEGHNVLNLLNYSFQKQSTSCLTRLFTMGCTLYTLAVWILKCNPSNKTHLSIRRSSSSWGLQKDL